MCLATIEGQGYLFFLLEHRAIALARWRGKNNSKVFPLMVIKRDMGPKGTYIVGKSFLFLFDYKVTQFLSGTGNKLLKL